MIEILLTCVLLGGSYTPPPEWQLVAFITQPKPGGIVTHCYAIEDGCRRAQADYEFAAAPRVKLKRTFKPGEKIQLPNDCTMETKP